MRTISSHVIGLLLTLVAAAGGEPEEKFGFIRLINAVAPGEGNLALRVAGADLYPDGYRLGDVTGGMGVPVGRCEVEVRKKGVKPGRTTIDVADGETTTVIPFAERVPASDEVAAHWRIRILRLKQKKESDRREVTFVSVSRQPEIKLEMRAPDGGWEGHFVKRLETTTGEMKYREGYVPLRLKAGDLPSIPVFDVGNYVVVLYDNEAGEVRALNFRDFRNLTAD